MKNFCLFSFCIISTFSVSTFATLQCKNFLIEADFPFFEKNQYLINFETLILPDKTIRSFIPIEIETSFGVISLPSAILADMRTLFYQFGRHPNNMKVFTNALLNEQLSTFVLPRETLNKFRNAYRLLKNTDFPHIISFDPYPAADTSSKTENNVIHLFGNPGALSKTPTPPPFSELTFLIFRQAFLKLRKDGHILPFDFYPPINPYDLPLYDYKRLFRIILRFKTMEALVKKFHKDFYENMNLQQKDEFIFLLSDHPEIFEFASKAYDLGIIPGAYITDDLMTQGTDFRINFKNFPDLKMNFTIHREDMPGEIGQDQYTIEFLKSDNKSFVNIEISNLKDRISDLIPSFNASTSKGKARTFEITLKRGNQNSLVLELTDQLLNRPDPATVADFFLFLKSI